MKLRNGCLGQEDILRVRLAIQEARDIDTRILEVLKDAEDTVLSAEDDHEVIKGALNEVGERLHYLASLDALWANIASIQEHMGSLRTYEYLEKQYLEKDVDNEAYDEESMKELYGNLDAFTEDIKGSEMEVNTAVMEEVDFGDEGPQAQFSHHGYSGRMADLGAEAQAAPFLGPDDPRLLKYCSCRRKKANKKAGKKEGKKKDKKGKKKGECSVHEGENTGLKGLTSFLALLDHKSSKAAKKAKKKAKKQEKK